MPKKKSKTRRESTARSTRSDLKHLSDTELKVQLKAREREIRKLSTRRSRLTAQLERINAEYLHLTGRAPSGHKRPRNTANLGDSLAKAMKRGHFTVPEAAEAVQAAGYKTTATTTNFRVIVNQRLISDPRFKKIRRGVYAVKTR